MSRYFVRTPVEADEVASESLINETADFVLNNSSGRFTVPETIAIRATCGSVEIDFTQADFLHERTTIRGNWMCGEVRLIVPVGVRIHVAGVLSVCGGSYDETHVITRNGTKDVGKFPTIEVDGLVLCGGFHVENDPGAPAIAIVE